MASPHGSDSVERFYDGFALDYHLAYGGEWDAAVRRQGSVLHRLIGEALPTGDDGLQRRPRQAPKPQRV